MDNIEPEELVDIDVETDDLLFRYIEAFANLYGIFPLRRALEIVRQQNPNLELTDDKFYAYAASVAFPSCIVASASEIYEGVAPAEPSDRKIIAEYLYEVDDFGGYEELEDMLDPDMDYYVPNKDHLLKYDDPYYTERTNARKQLIQFLQNRMEITNAEDIVDGLTQAARMCIEDMPDPVGDLDIELGHGFAGFTSRDEYENFCKLYEDTFNQVRLHKYKGHTPSEVGKIISGLELTPVPSSVFKLLPVRKGRKIGRNEPCPCGSGKKFKKCCIGKGIYD